MQRRTIRDGGPIRWLRAAAAAAILLVPEGRAAAQPSERPSEEALRNIEARGRRIAIFLAARLKARQGLQRETGSTLQSDEQVAIEKKEGSWHVVFTRNLALAAAGQNLVVVTETDYSPSADEVGAFKTQQPARPPLPATALYVRALQLGIGVAAKREEARPPFVGSVFKETDNTYSVYIQSKPEEGLARFGGDYRMKVSPDGLMVVGIEPLHAEVTDVPIPARAAGKPSLHSHSTGEFPSDTDVAVILMNPTLAPHLVMTPAWIFRIDAEGRITWIGPNQVPPPAPAPPARPPGGGAP